jgi:hypothetical protein
VKALVYETKVDSRASLRYRIFVAAEDIHNHPEDIHNHSEDIHNHPEDIHNHPEDIHNNPDRTASATERLILRAEKCKQSEEGISNNY